MPYLGLRGKKLLTAISVTAGVGFCLFGIDNAALGGVISSDPCMSFQPLAGSLLIIGILTGSQPPI